jgi:hypothetical protein
MTSGIQELSLRNGWQAERAGRPQVKRRAPMGSSAAATSGVAVGSGIGSQWIANSPPHPAWVYKQVFQFEDATGLDPSGEANKLPFFFRDISASLVQLLRPQDQVLRMSHQVLRHRLRHQHDPPVIRILDGDRAALGPVRVLRLHR